MHDDESPAGANPAEAGTRNGLATASLIVGLAAVGVPFLVRSGAHENRDVDGALSLYKAALSLAVARGLLVILLCVAAFRVWRRSRAGGLRIVLALSLACLLLFVEAPMMLLLVMQWNSGGGCFTHCVGWGR